MLWTKNIKTAAVAVILAGWMLFAAVVAGEGDTAVQVDKNLPTYKPVEGISGSIKSVGSDTCNEIMAGWIEEFKKLYPGVKTEMEGKGSTTAPPALIERTAQLGPMSRPMKGTEIEAFKKVFGYPPTEIKIAVDALGIYVNKDNPIKSLTLADLKKLFSVEGPANVTWGEIGVTDPEFKDKPVELYGRNSASGTYGYFKEHALGKKDFKPTVKEQPGSSGVIQAVGSSKFAVGYSGIGYMTADVRVVPIKLDDKAEAFTATAENAYSGDYPLSRFLYVYVNARPGEEPTPVVREFVKMIASQQGQQVTVKHGFFPLPKPLADEGVKKVTGGNK